MATVAQPTFLPADLDEVPPKDDIAAIIENIEGGDTAVPDPAPLPFGRTWAFDVRGGRFVRFGNAPAVVDGLDSLKVWVACVLQTARLAHPIFTEEYGMDDPWAFQGMPPGPDLYAIYSEDVSEALLVHDRIDAVVDFEFAQDEDVVYASFIVITNGDLPDMRMEDVIPGVAE